MRILRLGKLFGLQISVLPSAWIGFLFLWIGLTIIARFGIGLTLEESILMGFIATLLHWTFELVHSLGHAYAAKLTRYPMTGILFGTLYIFAGTRYPADEPELPPSIHISRALGGPIINGLLSILIFLTLPLWTDIWHWLGLFAFYENIFVYTLQIFIPLGFNDGSTILRNLRRIRKSI